MRGQEPLVAMRLRGQLPASVTIDVDRALPAWLWRDWAADREWAFQRPVHARLVVERGEAAQRLDLRCVIGLTVQVCGDDAERVQAVARACQAAQAQRVITAVPVGDDIHMTDTEGALTWPR